MNKGKLVVISGPSGIGKGTVCKELIQKDKSVVPSVSWTTRERRKGEEEGVTYFYRTDHHWTTTGAYVAFQQAASVMELDPSAVRFEHYPVSADLRRALRHAARLCRSKNA